jgi:transcription elongation factor Elf1
MICEICIISDTIETATHQCINCGLDICDNEANHLPDHRRIDLDFIDPAGAGRRAAKVEKDSPEHNCKHGVDVYNCYDGCYDEMKNGTVS